MPLRPLPATAALALGVAVLVAALTPSFASLRAGREDEGYLPSRSCRSCHPDHHASWAKTHHSRMTQEAGPSAVVGDFVTANRFDYLGVRAVMSTRDGRYFMTLHEPGGRSVELTVDRTIGSRRIQQYASRVGDRYVRLPLAWDIERRRWMSLNGSFFHPDGNDYDQHQAVWDLNCVFCHNVKAQPGLDRKANRLSTEVAELGIACGSCHGRSAEHVESAMAPWTRAFWRFSERTPRRGIVLPTKLTPEKALMVCGHCHGQRVPEPLARIESVLSTGDPFDAGEDLSTFYRPVSRETKIGSFSFAARFWNDGSPRLTAYEYQGILGSACFQKGSGEHRMTCLTCHSMHEGDPKGQITNENRGDAPCLSCHGTYATPAAMKAHSGHAAESSGSRCYACHMPRVVYGVMAAHPTHEITVPDARLTISSGKPNACNQCHLDRSVRWAIAESSRLWPSRFSGDSPAGPASADDPYALPEGARGLFAGDAVVRALTAEALSGGGPMKPEPRWARPLLVEAFADRYPIVRFFAANGLGARSSDLLPKPDYLATDTERLAALSAWRGLVRQDDASAAEQALRWREALASHRVEVDIEVGE